MRLVVVSNRLGVTANLKPDGGVEFKESAGGLASALNSYFMTEKYKELNIEDFLWVGWPGIEIPAEKHVEVRERLLKDYKSWPVFLPEKIMDRFYSGFCNRTVWPLFHYFPMMTTYEQHHWECYNDVNNFFASSLSEILKPDDIIWIHDYQLMLLPAMLREFFSDAAIGYFHHIPFPSYEIFRLLPGAWREKIMRGLLGADLTGFHTVDYTHHFLRCASRITNLENSFGKMLYHNRIMKADTFPIGIEFDKFNDAARRDDVQAEIDLLRPSFAGKKIILSIDRLDYTKGIANRLKGFRAFLEKHHELHEKIIMISIVVPSRVKVPQYQALKKQVDELVGEINGKFGSVDWTPLVYRYKSISFAHLAALYILSDIAMVTPLRDGMNLVAKEYLACKKSESGVLILSEMAGAANELTDAVIMNPNNTESYVDAIETALGMDYQERKIRLDNMRARICQYSVIKWAEDFIGGLIEIYNEQRGLNSKYLDEARRFELTSSYSAAHKRLILLDYDGTLVNFVKDPEKAVPGDSLILLLKKLADDEKNNIVIISGRGRSALQKWLGGLKINFVAEHGAWIKNINQQWRPTVDLKTDWKKSVIKLMSKYCGRLAGSFIEEKDFAVAWHYRASDSELARARANELASALAPLIKGNDINMLKGKCVIEVRTSKANKCSGALEFIKANKYDFIFFAGDDATDEDLFNALDDGAYTIKIGAEQTAARFNLINPAGLLDFLGRLADLSNEDAAM